MIDPRPLDLMPADRADPDPQGAGIDLMAALRAIDQTRDDLQRLLSAWGDDPVTTMRRAQARAIELQQLVPQAAALGERLMRAHRSAGTFRVPAGRP